MKKLILLGSILTAGLVNAQTPNYPYSQNFDANTSIPTGWASNSFSVMAGHGDSPNNAIVAHMNSTHTSDTLTTIAVGPLTTSSQLSINYRVLSSTLYPSQTTTLLTNDQIVIQASSPTPPYSSFGWVNATTLNGSSTPAYASSTTYNSFTYNTSSLPISLAGAYIQLRIIVQRDAASTVDYFVDIDDYKLMDAVGIQENPSNSLMLKIYPNPSADNFNVFIKNYKNEKPVEITLSNGLGQVVKTMKIDQVLNNSVNINTSGLTKGIYLLDVKNGDATNKSKIVIE